MKKARIRQVAAHPHSDTAETWSIIALLLSIGVASRGSSRDFALGEIVKWMAGRALRGTATQEVASYSAL